METVGYRFQFLDLTASEGLNKYFREVVFLGGVLNTVRSKALIDSELPVDLDTPEAAAAWASYALQSHRGELEPLPDWMLYGELNRDQLPWVRKQREFEARPRCYINRDPDFFRFTPSSGRGRHLRRMSEFDPLLPSHAFIDSPHVTP